MDLMKLHILENIKGNVSELLEHITCDWLRIYNMTISDNDTIRLNQTINNRVRTLLLGSNVTCMPFFLLNKNESLDKDTDIQGDPIVRRNRRWFWCT